MARANAGNWIKLVAGLVVGAAAVPLSIRSLSIAVSGSALLAAPLPDRPLPLHEALNNAIECHRRGDYEEAADLFKYVEQRKAELSESEQKDWYHFWHENVMALDARREGDRQLRIIDKALYEGRVGEATELLKKMLPYEQYLTPADKAKYKELYSRVMGKPIELPKPIAVPPPQQTGIVKPLSTGGVSGSGSLDTNSTPVNTTLAKPTLADGRAKLQQARAQLNQANIELAEKLVHEAERMGVSFPPAEDTPAKVLQDIAKARGDAKTLLLAARAAMGRQEFDAAEKYAKQSEAVAGPFTFPVWASDTPAKVLKELKELKDAHAAKAQTVPATPATGAPPAPTQAANVTTTNSNKPPVPVQPAQDEPDHARLLVQQGRKALVEKKLELAKQLAEQAKALHPKLAIGEDSPEKLLADVAHAEAMPDKRNGKVEPATLTEAPKPDDKKLPATKEEAVVLIKLARKQLAEGKIDEAQMTAMKARAARNVGWGIFDDSPDTALKDIEKARVKRDQEESVKVLAEGRKLLAQGDWEGAQRLAYRAQKLHGPYQFWEMGDRPDKLLADAQVVRSQPRKPDAAVAKKDDQKPDVKPATPLPPVNPPANAVTPVAATMPAQPAAVPQPPSTPEALHTQAQQMLRDARLALKNGDVAKAKAITGQVAVMKVTYAPRDDCPALVYEEIRKIEQSVVAPVATQPVMSLPPLPPVQPQVDAAKAKSLQLLAEGRALQKAGRLIEAQQKCMQAQACGAKFGPDEDNPVQAVNQINTAAQQQVNALAKQATEAAAYGTGDPQPRYQKADQMLQEALHLAHHFGFDTATLDRKVAELQERRAQASGMPAKVAQPEIQLVSQNPMPSDLQRPLAPPPPVEPMRQGPAPVQPPQMVDLAKKGRQLLDQARNELRQGALGQARNLAMEAMKDEYGVSDEAAALLRSIDTEAFSRKCRDDQHTFDAALANYQRHDYARATLLIGAIDPRNLDDKRKGQLRELMQTPEMLGAESAVAHVDPQQSGSPEVLPPVSGGAATDTGHARATDTQPASPEKDILKQTTAMRSVLFQKLRTDGLKAQNDAADKFRTGQTDLAVDVLKQYLADLDTVRDLDAGQLALLRKPVENRLKSFELMKLQEDVKNNDKMASSKAMEAHTQRLAAKDSKEKKVAELMNQCNGLIKDQKLEEAYRLVMVIKQMDPDNPAVEALFLMAQIKRNLAASLKNKDQLAEYFERALDDTDNYGTYRSNDNPLEVNLERRLNAQKRGSLDAIIQRKSRDMIEMENKLMTPATINFKDVPMRQALDDLSQQYALNFNFDDATLLKEGITLDRPVSLRLDRVMLKTALELLLKKLSLSYTVADRYIDITTKENAKGQLVRKVYSVTDLIVPIEHSIQEAPGAPLMPGQQNASSSSPLASVSTNGYAQPTPIGGYGSMMMPGTPTGDSSGGNYTPQGNPNDMNELANQYGHTKIRMKKMTTREDALIKLITNTIEPLSWNDAGGQGSIDYWPMGGALVLNQTLDVQEQVADLLQALRRLQDQEVAIEVRLITVDEDYYERIGLDFSMNIATNSRNNKFEPALLANSFAPPNQFNTAATGAANGLLAGITPAGTLTPDLSIPIQPNSFTPAAPTFGGYQGSGVGGLALGLAFLSDIQVSMFLEAVAGDARSSISQSPRLTLQNGQQATISIIDNLENLVTAVTLTQLPNGGFALVPQVQPINNEVDLQLSAVISADRRFVRLSPQVNLNNVSISNPAPAPTPILLPIYPGLSVTDPGNAVVYTQYIQQPQRISTINITTTVTVPDGGTVVMGGLKRMSEGRLEYGPPVLSKIPYIDRLFRNVGYGRSGTSILIMVTPRIIIQEEEEERATGFRIGPAVQE